MKKDLEKIQAHVAEHFDLWMWEVKDKSRTPVLSQAKKAFTLLADEFTTRTSKEIQLFIGYKELASVWAHLQNPVMGPLFVVKYQAARDAIMNLQEPNPKTLLFKHHG